MTKRFKKTERPSVFKRPEDDGPACLRGVRRVLRHGLVAWTDIDEKGMTSAVGKAFTWITSNSGSLYLLSAFALIVTAFIVI